MSTSFKLIESDMIVKNNIILEPRITFVSASNFCEDIISHNIDTPGVYGEIPALNTINSYSGSMEFGTRVYNAGELTARSPCPTVVEILNSARLHNDEDSFERELNENNISFDSKYTHKFGVEKIKQRFTIDDSSYYKKKAVKNLYTYYNENIEHRQFNSQWGFSNYNTINFFNIDESLNSLIVANKTHSNCLAYPNLTNNSKQAYDFFSDDLTFSFYINQRRKNKKGYHFNPGCILSIPKLISIFIVKGSKTDINGLTENYRIYIELGDKTLGDTNTNILTLDSASAFSETGSYQSSDGKLFLSSDNIIKFNNWHNITVTISKSGISNEDENHVLKLYNDGNLIDTVDVMLLKTKAFLGGSSFITIGNKFNNISTENLQSYINELYSINSEANDDIIGPYSTKSISFGNHSVPFVTDINSNFTPVLTDNLSEDTQSYVVKNTTSHALNAEIHDIRIYSKNIGSLIKQKICNQNIIDYTDDSIIFAVPVFYYEAPVKKLGLINIHTTNTGITRSNIYLDGPVNSYFSNKCLGHEVNVENFLYDFKQKISPNVIFGNSLKNDNLHSALALIYKQENLAQPTSNICRSAAEGLDLLDVYYRKLKSNDLKPNEIEIARKNHFYYRNNLILPNDNGLQDQIYDIKGYYTNYNGFSHRTYKSETDYQHVNLEKVHSEKIAMKISNDFVSSIANQDLMNYTAKSGLLKNINNRDNFYIDLYFTFKKSFKESYDLFENASLNNFHKGINLDNNNNNMFGLKRSTFVTQTIEKGDNFFLKDLSNPVSRKINNDFRTSGIANTQPTISNKIIDDSLDNPDSIGYFAYELPYYNITKDMGETYSNILCISKQIHKKNIVRETFSIFDSALAGSGGNLKINLSDNGLGLLYRNDCETKAAEWNYVGHILYKEGFATILHPGLENFAKTNYKLEFKINTSLNVYELNLPAKAGEVNLSKNSSYIKDLKLNSSAFNADEDFVYITDIDIHDDNLNVLANAKIIKPFAKKNTDNVLFRLKMDY